MFPDGKGAGEVVKLPGPVVEPVIPGPPLPLTDPLALTCVWDCVAELGLEDVPFTKVGVELPVRRDDLEEVLVPVGTL